MSKMKNIALGTIVAANSFSLNANTPTALTTTSKESPTLECNTAPKKMSLNKDIPYMQALVFFEGCSLTSYQDAGGIWTVGIGTIKLKNGTPVDENTTLTPQEICEETEAYTKNKIDNIIKHAIKRSLNENEKKSLRSIMYNLGSGMLEKKGISTPLAYAINKRNTARFESIVSQHHYVTKRDENNKPYKKSLNGLRVRRYMEIAIYEGKITTDDIAKFYIGNYGRVDAEKLFDSKGMPIWNKETIQYVKDTCNECPPEEDIKKNGWFGYGKRVYELMPSSTTYMLQKTAQR